MTAVIGENRRVPFSFQNVMHLWHPLPASLHDLRRQSQPSPSPGDARLVKLVADDHPSPYSQGMSALAELESSIKTLPARDFLELAAWMTDQHLKLLASDEFESPELEEALLRSMDAPRHPVNEALYDHVRTAARTRLA